MYRCDGGVWMPAAPSDGLYDQPMELYTFSTIPLSHGPHLIETFSINNVGNSDSTYASDTVTIDNPPNKPTLTGTPKGNTGQPYMYNCSAADMDADSVFYWFDWADGANSGWLGPFPPGTLIHVNHTWSAKGTYKVGVKAKDIYNMEGNWAYLNVTMPVITIFDNSFLQEFFLRHPLLSYLFQLLINQITIVT
jgi:hypothetical protein